MLNETTEVEQAEAELSKGTSPFHKVAFLRDRIDMSELTGVCQSSWVEQLHCSYVLR
jgi:hypothetical protein